MLFKLLDHNDNTLLTAEVENLPGLLSEHDARSKGKFPTKIIMFDEKGIHDVTHELAQLRENPSNLL